MSWLSFNEICQAADSSAFRKKREEKEKLGKQFLLSPKIYHFYSSTQKTSMRPRGGAQSELGERRCTQQEART